MTRDMVFAIGMLILAGVMYLETLSFPPGTRFRAGPATFPVVLLTIIAGLSLILLLRTIITQGARPHLPIAAIGQTITAYWLVPTVFALFGLFVVALRYAGFVPAALGFLMIGQVLIAKRIDVRYLVRALAISGVATLLIYYTFSHLLRIWLP